MRCDAGSLTITNANGLQNATIDPSGAGTFSLPATATIGGLTGSASFGGAGATTSLTIGGGTIDVSANYTGNFSANLTLTKARGGTQQLSGVSTRMNAGTTISGGATQLNSATGLYASAASNTTTVNSGGGLWLNGITTNTSSQANISGNGVSLNGALRNFGGNSTHTATITLGGSARIFNDVASTTFTLKNIAVGAANTLTLDTGATSTATILLDGTANTASGTSTIVVTGSGLVKAPRQATLQVGRPVTVSAGSRLQFTDATATIGVVNSTLSSTAGGTPARIILGA